MEERLYQGDPIAAAAERLMGVRYLFPYQRLVLANIIEAAAAAGIGLRYPPGPDGDGVPAAEPDGPGDDADDGAARGRQIVILPTGAGKSLCFQLPALLMDRPTLVLYPILALMADQERRLSERGFEPAVLRGGQSAEERQRIWNRLEAGSCRFLIANPEVLLTESVARRLPDLGIAHLVLDEAHCVSEWGESFRPSYLRVAEIRERCRAPLTTAFTATASPAVLDKIRSYVFGAAGAHCIIGNPDRPNIDYAVQNALLRDAAVRDLLRSLPRPAIVFCAGRRRTERLARYLRGELGEEEVRFYHAGLERDEKTETEAWFFRSPRGILTATCAYGLGVDKADIRTVVHRDCPPSVEAYLQESGRAGRDGAPSRAVLLRGPEDELIRSRLSDGADRDRYDRLLDYGRNGVECRRRALLSLLGTEGGSCPPGEVACDVCRGTVSDRLREERSLVGFISRNRRRYTKAEAARIAAEESALGISEEEASIAFSYFLRVGRITAHRGPLRLGRLTVGRTRPASGPPG